MDKKKAVRTMLKRFKDLPENSKMIFYNNPSLFKRFDKEQVNPNHIHFIYGQYKNKIAKSKKSCHIKIAKVILPSIFILDVKIIINTIVMFLLWLLAINNPVGIILNIGCAIFYMWLTINILDIKRDGFKWRKKYFSLS